ncbi:uncharacterized protein Z519_08162 [Cladophialophora bantiana CBS 173.52]|uniref:Uncharacterized protein n=1 Tax=Cladophialophora bantiana (strain ATCC 10958 / CBS 173.52 / CDC B-1940 / NIH 8579) TaxID=1442370 RepID=A0A0D2EMM4_CLAB1|nr:uncharacterized protein Z519_08162 [Cladophialophora bantiana CBS 173.52]KIW91266.1 hypothetical protein Z519_08162 [Cladophialophora bantiana CBS 173.52]
MSVKIEEPGALKKIEEIVSSESESDGPEDSASMTSNASTSTHTLEEAINSANTMRLRTVLLQMCHENAVCRYLAGKALMVPAQNAEPDPKTGMKRLRKVYEMCCQYSKEYQVERNEKVRDSARIILKLEVQDKHPVQRYKEVDCNLHFWDDHDPDCHGDPGSFVDDPDYQEGFIWDCCDEDGNAEGCETSRHRPTRSVRAKD